MGRSVFRARKGRQRQMPADVLAVVQRLDDPHWHPDEQQRAAALAHVQAPQRPRQGALQLKERAR